MKIALIDDSRSILAAFELALAELGDATTHCFLDPSDALSACATTVFDLVIVDYMMPRLSGLDVVRALRRLEAYRLVPIVMITSETEPGIRLDAIEAGATEFLGKPFDRIELKARVKNLLALRQAQLALADRAETLSRAVTAATRDIVAREEEVIWRLARAIEFRDGNTGDHISRVADICRLLAEDFGLDAGRCRMIYLAAPLHDVGKIAIPDIILLKPGKLAPEEMDVMRSHVEIGERILADGTSELIRIAASIAGGHHEKWDGSGYPRGLAGEQIPLEARIAAVADVFEALCSERPYKNAWPTERAYAEILACSGSHFDPACVAAFKRQWPNILSALGLPSEQLIA